MEATVKRFKAQLEKLRVYRHAMGIMNYDMETVMPKGAAALASDTLGALSEVTYRLQTDETFVQDTNAILQNPDKVDAITLAEAKRMNEQRERIACIPIEEYVAYQVEQTLASAVWHSAKVNNDFAAFLPHLEKVIDYKRRFALYFRPDAPVYETLLDGYEKGLNIETLDAFFAAVREKVVPLLHRVQTCGYEPRTDFLYRFYPKADQEKLTEYLMRVLCLPPEHTVCGEVEHPFTTEFTKADVRITTHYHEDAVHYSMYSVIHESGHATYELNIADEIARSPLGAGVSMSVHESQSRFFENIIGRSEPFITFLFPKLKELFPEQLSDVTAHEFYLAVNKAEPTLIRTEADELTYALHVMVRYELEKQLFDGTLAAKDLPAAWNALYKEYLGIDVPSDREGVLQDSHWSTGLFGYFPSYAVGSAYGAQLIKRMEQDLDVWELVRRGDLKPIIAWLTDRIYRYGRRIPPKELMERAFEAPFDPKYFTDYLTKKYSEIYPI